MNRRQLARNTPKGSNPFSAPALFAGSTKAQRRAQASRNAQRARPMQTSSGRVAAPLALGSAMSGNQGTPSNVSFPLRRKEYVADVAGSVTFATTAYSLNPGLSSPFQWGSSIAPSFEEYDSLTVAFHYEPMDSANSTGAVIISFDYDAVDAAPVDKTEALTYSDNVRVQPWVPAVLVLKKSDLQKRGRLYTRTGTIASTDIKTYDLGNVYVSTVGQADTDIIGEFWISYHFNLVTPQKPSPPGTYIAASTGVTKAAPFGTAQTVTGTTPITIGSTTLTFKQPGYFLLNFLVVGTGLTATAATISTGGTVTENSNTFPNAAGTLLWVAYEVRVLAGSVLTLDFSTGNTTVTSTNVTVAPWFTTSGFQ
jgi:hypothetical protein